MLPNCWPTLILEICPPNPFLLPITGTPSTLLPPPSRQRFKIPLYYVEGFSSILLSGQTPGLSLLTELPGCANPGGTIHKEYNLNGAQGGANCTSRNRNGPPGTVQGLALSMQSSHPKNPLRCFVKQKSHLLGCPPFAKFSNNRLLCFLSVLT